MAPTERAHALLASSKATLARCSPKFDVHAWGDRMPDDPTGLKAWLAELPDEPAPETDYERHRREREHTAQLEAEAKEKEREERARKKREALTAASQPPAPARLARRSNTPAWAGAQTGKIVFKEDAPIIRKVIETRHGEQDD